MSDPTNSDGPLCIDEIVKSLPECERQLINILNEVQEQKGYISEDDARQAALLTQLPESVVHGLISFFASFRTLPSARNHLSVCWGTACYARGASLIYDRLAGELELDEDGNSTDGFITLDKVQCVGACSLAPVICTNGRLEGKVKAHQMPSKLQEMRKRDVPVSTSD